MGSSQSTPEDGPRLARRALEAHGKWQARCRSDMKILFGMVAGQPLPLTDELAQDGKPGAPETSATGAEDELKESAEERNAPLERDSDMARLLITKYIMADRGLAQLEVLAGNVCRRIAYADALHESARKLEKKSPSRADHRRRCEAYARAEAARDCGRYDQACAAVDWLREDYILSVAVARITGDLAAAMNEDDKSRVKSLRKDRSKAEKALAEHQIGSLSVGLKLLDSDFSGKASPANIGAAMSSELFVEVDSEGDGAISTSELERFVRKQSEKRDKLTERRDKAAAAAEKAGQELGELLEQREQEESDSRRKKREKLEVSLARANEELDAARSELHAAQGKLDKVYHVFGVAFAKGALAELGMDSPSDIQAQIDTIRARLVEEDERVAAGESVPTKGALDESV